MAQPYLKPVNPLSLFAAADLSAKAGYAVTINSSEQFALPTVAGQKCVGILVDANASGYQSSAETLGVAHGKLGGTVSIGDSLCADTDGRLIAATGTPGAWVIGKALQAGVVNDLIAVAVNAYGGSAPQPVQTLSFVVDAATLANGDVITAYPLTFAGRVAAIRAVCVQAVTTGAKAATINAEIGTTNLTGGVVTLSGTYALGAVVAGTAVTAANAFVAGDTLSIEASSVTTFVEGRFAFYVDLIPN